MTLDASSRLGIGETSPAQLLDLKSAATDITAVRFQNTSTNGRTFVVGAVGSGGYFDAPIGSWSIRDSTAGATRLSIDSSGNLLVGTTNAVIWNTTNTGVAIGGASDPAIQVSRSGDASLLLNRTTSDGNIAIFARQGLAVGNIAVSTIATTYNSISDYRLKNVIGAVTGAGERIDALEPIEYEWKADGSQTRGFLAHKFQEVYPQSVSGEKDAVDEQGKPKYQNMQAGTSEVIADLVAEIQSLRQRLAALESK
jgi:hypothetical protein